MALLTILTHSFDSRIRYIFQLLLFFLSDQVVILVVGFVLRTKPGGCTEECYALSFFPRSACGS